MIKSLHLAIVIVILTGWYNENIGIGLKILITILAVFIFIALVINDFLKNKKARKEVMSEFSSAIDEILNSLYEVWNKYQKTTKDIYQQKRVVVEANAFHTIPAEFRHILPGDWRWKITKLYPIPSAFVKKEKTQIDKFCGNIIKIISLYNQIRDLGSGSHDAAFLPAIRTQWESLISEVLEQGNPLKPHNKRI